MKAFHTFLACAVTVLVIVFSHSIKAQSLVPIDRGTQDESYSPPFKLEFDRSIDISLPVGRISGSPDVSSNGGATYQVPIDLPPGTAGMLPNLNIVYNSQGGDGQLGLGWGITGLSEIRRTPKTILQDGEPDPVRWLNTDALALDGNRLRLMSGSPLANGAVYGQELEDFSKIYVSNVEGVPCFQVWTKSGMVISYGCSTESRQTASGGAPYRWLIDRVEDMAGNYYSYHYTTLLGEVVLDRIKYTGNGSLVPYWEVVFQYIPRQDANEQFEQGLSLKQRALLRRIIVAEVGTGTVAKKYFLQYAEVDDHSVLRQITEVGKNGGTLNSTIIKYGATTPLHEVHSSIDDGPASSIWLPGDYDGDGITDMANFYAVQPVPNSFNAYHSCNMLLSDNSNGSFSSHVNGPLATPAFVPFETTHATFLAMDYNGDGSDDIMTLKVHPSNELSHLYLYESPFQGGSLPAPTVIETPDGTILPISPNFALKNPVIPGDYNGDGRTDLLTIQHRPGIVGYGPFFTLSGTSTQFQEIDDIGISDWVDFSTIKPLDFNGDGKTDLMLIDENGTKVITYREVTGQWVAELLYSAGYPTSYHNVTEVADFNGDGKADLLTFNGSIWQVAYSRGNGLHTTTITNLPLIAIDDLRHIVVGDFTGDGLGDILQITRTSTTAQNSTIVLCKSTGEDFEANLLSSNGFFTADGSISYVGDYNGDGKSDILHRANEPASTPMQLLHVQPEGFDRLVHEVSDGYAHSVEYHYQPLTNDNVYSKGADLGYPFHKTQLPVHVVTHISRPDGISAGSPTNLNTYYRYEGAVLHSRGRGLLGFEHVWSWSDLSSTLFSHNYAELQDDVALLKGVSSKTTYGANPGSAISSTHSSASYQSISNDRWWFKTDDVRVTDHLNGGSGITGYTYDSYGNVTHTLSFTGQDVNGGGLAQQMSQTVHQYGSYHSNCNPGKITSTTVQEDRQGQPTVTKTTDFGYQNNGWKLTSKTDWPGMPQQVLTYYQQHNAFGLAERTAISASGAPTRITEHIYDSKGRFVEETVNEIGQSAYYTYDPMSGNVLTETSIEQLTQSHAYDEFHRPILYTDVLGNNTTSSYTWDVLNGVGTNPTGAENALYHVTVNAPGTDPVITYYDAFGRKRKTSFKGFSGQDLQRVWTYDAHGALKTTTEPFEFAQDALITTNDYTAVLHRIDKVHDNGAAGNTQYTYANVPGTLLEPKHYKITVASPAGSATKIYDMTGSVVKTSDHGGDLEFEYDSWGNMKSVHDGNNVLSSMVYDAYGRQIKLNDLSAGTVDYVYNAYGWLTSQTHGAGNTQTITYDALGRTLTETGPEGTETYTYVSSGNGLNQLQSVQAFNGLTKSYTYDGHHRLETETSTIGYPLTKTYYYDGIGRMVKESYSTGFDIEYDFNTHGFADEVRYVNGGSSVTLAQATATNVLGQYTHISLGSGQTAEIEYNAYGLPVHYLTSGIFDLSMNWDVSTGNLDQRTNALGSGGWGITEDFVHIDQQLQKWQVSSPMNVMPFLETGVNSIGNVEDRFDAGSEYAYGAYKVSRVKNDNWVIPADVQTVTYTAFNEPDQIEEGDQRIEFVYGPGKTRIQSRRYENNSNQISELRHYLPEMGYEAVKIGATEYELHYVPLFGNVMAVINKNNAQGGNAVFDLFYVHQDHLGSWLTVTDDAGNVVGEQNFDAWGRRRDPNLWNYSNNQSPLEWLIRGYTGHEHLDEFSIIHMNGRLYDPVVGRMFSPDNYVHDAFYSRSYNRYAYAYNNPLRITDPDGELPHILIGAGIGGLLNLGMMAYQGKINSFQDGAVAFGIGAVAGAVGAATGGAAFLAAGGAAAGAGGFGAGAAAGAIGTGFANPIQNIGNALYFQEPFMSFQDHVIGIAVGALIGGSINGIIAARNGLDPLRGKVPPPVTEEPLPINIGGKPHISFDSPEMMHGVNGNKNIVWDVDAERWIAQKTASASTPSTTGLRNGHLAGKVHPKTGVPFTKSGFPNFKNYLYGGGKNDVIIRPTGSRTGDFAAANKVAGYKSTPNGYTWHHHESFGRMQLVEKGVHLKTGHTGGFSIWGQ